MEILLVALGVVSGILLNRMLGWRRALGLLFIVLVGLVCLSLVGVP